MSDKVLHLQDADFETEVLQSDKLTLVDFWAPWCGPCKMIGPIIEELADEMDNVKFCKINVDDSSEVAAKLNIMSIPTLILYKNGQKVASKIGAMPKDALKEFILQNL